MLYLNQLDYPNMHYNHNTDAGGAPEEHSNVAKAGCGLCCVCMMVENLTQNHLPLEECLALSEQLGANRKPGTDLKILGKEVAQRCGLAFTTTDDLDILIAHLQKGGMAVANSGGDRDGYKGVFTHGGHYIAVLSYDGQDFCILDPSYKEGKFEEEGRQGKVDITHAPYLYCAAEVLKTDCANRSPAYYLFDRAK